MARGELAIIARVVRAGGGGVAGVWSPKHATAYEDAPR